MSSQALKLISLNIEKEKHIPLVLEFLKKEKPDVVCLQEIFEETFELFKEELGIHGVFCEETFIETDDGIKHREGVAILSPFPIVHSSTFSYKGDEVLETSARPATISATDQKDKSWVNKYNAKKLLVADLEVDDTKWRCATTHFTWGYYGRMNRVTKKFTWDILEENVENQMRDLERLLRILHTLGELVFTVDLNAPRGQKIFDTLATHLKDNIPAHYTTSIDASMHHIGPLPLMVDGLFTTPDYEASDVVLKSDVSDHYAVVANIEQVPIGNKEHIKSSILNAV